MDDEPRGDPRRDPHTGLGTRWEGMELLRRDLERGVAGAVVFCDLDHFVWFNRENGHFRGDELLGRVATILAPSGEDVVGRDGRDAYRIGGEEFLIRLPGTDLHGAKTFAEEARHKIKQLPAVLDAAQSEGRPFSARFVVAAWRDGQAPSFAALCLAVESSLGDPPMRDAVSIIQPEPA